MIERTERRATCEIALERECGVQKARKRFHRVELLLPFRGPLSLSLLAFSITQAQTAPHYAVRASIAFERPSNWSSASATCSLSERWNPFLLDRQAGECLVTRVSRALRTSGS